MNTETEYWFTLHFLDFKIEIPESEDLTEDSFKELTINALEEKILKELKEAKKENRFPNFIYAWKTNNTPASRWLSKLVK